MAGIERNLSTVGNETGEWQAYFLPLLLRDKVLAVGLPRSCKIRSSEMETVFLCIASDVNRYAGAGGSVYGAAGGSEIKGKLKKSAVVREANSPLHPDCLTP